VFGYGYGFLVLYALVLTRLLWGGWGVARLGGGCSVCLFFRRDMWGRGWGCFGGMLLVCGGKERGWV